MTTIARFIAELSSLKLDNCFNPYLDRCATSDHHDAPDIRTKYLKLLVSSAAESGIDSLWIGRDLGYRGGRRTGLAFTDDRNLSRHLARYDIPLTVPTKETNVKERTASVVWEVLDKSSQQFFLWNVFPLHPHEPESEFTNRAHTAYERKIGEEILRDLIGLLSPRVLVAVGKAAEASAVNMLDNRSVITLRHPSYGGQAEFRRKAATLWK